MCYIDFCYDIEIINIKFMILLNLWNLQIMNLNYSWKSK